MRITIARALLAIVTIGSAFPLIAINGLLWSAIGIAGGFLLVEEYSPLQRVAISSFAFCAFFGVFTLSNLVIHYWRTPFDNPMGRTAIKYICGLILGWLAMFTIMFGKFNDSDVLALGTFLLLPNAILVSSFWLLNCRRKPADG
jgi:hypothetical protein